MEERKRSTGNKRRVVRTLVAKDKTAELAVTPELLMTRFQNDYTQCTLLQKKGVKKKHDALEKELEKLLKQNRGEWSAAFDMLVEKTNRLEELLHCTADSAPVTLLGVPSQQLEQLERVSYWARMVLNKRAVPVNGSIHQLLDEVTELKHKVQEKQQVSEKLSVELVALGSRHQAVLQDCITKNSPVFHLQEVLTKNVYNPAFDHNDVYYFFPDLESVIHFHSNLVESCIREQVVPVGAGFEKLKQAPLPTVENLAGGFFIGLLLITNMEDTSDNNYAVNDDNMCCSVGEQLSGIVLKPGKKYVTWYVGQYAQDNAMDSPRLWSQAMDTLFYSVQKCPMAWNSEFVKGWKATRVPGHEKPLYTCILPGTKEVTRETWATVETLDWISRNVHFWTHQLNTYAPLGYNLPLNHHFHRSLFLEVPKLHKFPQLWQYKKVLAAAVQDVKDLYGLLERSSAEAVAFLRPMTKDFYLCNFHLVYYQWEPVKEKLFNYDRVLTQFKEGQSRLTACLMAVQQSVTSKLCQVEAWSRLYNLDVVDAVGSYNRMMQLLCEEGDVLTSSESTSWLASVSVQAMTECEHYTKHLDGCDSSWFNRLCVEVGCQGITVDTLFQHLPELTVHVKKTRNDCHPDRGLCVDPDSNFFHLFQSWHEKLQSIEKLHVLFFSKVR